MHLSKLATKISIIFIVPICEIQLTHFANQDFARYEKTTVPARRLRLLILKTNHLTFQLLHPVDSADFPVRTEQGA